MGFDFVYKFFSETLLMLKRVQRGTNIHVGARGGVFG